MASNRKGRYNEDGSRRRHGNNETKGLMVGLIIVAIVLGVLTYQIGGVGLALLSVSAMAIAFTVGSRVNGILWQSTLSDDSENPLH